MIATVTLNLALDVTYAVPQVAWHAANRVTAVQERAGGKGVNVSRVLHALGHETVVCGFAGGPTGEAIRADLASARLDTALSPIAGNSRRTVAVVDRSAGDATRFWEPGPSIAPGDGALSCAPSTPSSPMRVPSSSPAAFRQGSNGRLRRAVPPGAACRHSGRPRRRRGGLARGVGGAARGDQAQQRGARPRRGEADSVRAARVLRRQGADAVVVSRGAEGLLSLTPEGSWRAAPVEPIAATPTGAGDAAVAALTAGLALGRSWPERIADAVALSAAAVGSALAGGFDEDIYRRNLARVEVESVAAG